MRRLLWYGNSLGSDRNPNSSDNPVCLSVRSIVWHILPTTMRIAGKKLDLAEWCLYGTHSDTSLQTYSDCGLYTVFLDCALPSDIFLKIINRERITAARCLLLLKLIYLDPKKAKPLLHRPVGREHKSWVLHPFHYVGKGLSYSDVPFSLILKNAMKNSDQATLDGYNGSGFDHNTPPKLLGSEDKHAVVNLMTLSLQPITPAVILDLTSPEQKLTQPLVTTPEKDTEKNTGETNDGKQGSLNSDPPGNKGNGSKNEGNASGSPPSGGGGAEGGDNTGGNGNGGGGGGEDDTGGNGNGGRDADHPDNSNPGACQGSQKKKKRRPWIRKAKGESPTQSSPCHQPPTKATPDKTQPDSVVKQLFSSLSKTRRSSRKKTQKTNPPAASFSTKPEDPLLFHLCPR
jgi:uncharacterized membrane protein YgcG